MGIPLTVVDSFTDTPYSGNPAGVCRLEEAASEAWMLAVAAEVNLAETAFLVPRPDGSHDLRWFTPTVEVPLCGHATLASAHVLGGSGTFHTLSGVLTCTSTGDGTIQMDFPATAVTLVDPPPSADAWGAAVGLPADRLLSFHGGGEWLLIEVASADDVRAAVPDEAALLALGGHCLLVADVSAVTEGPDAPYDSVCRHFVPAFGILEDPVTGAAHTVIGPWLAARTGRTTFVGHQASRRGGSMAMDVRGDRVLLTGTAVTISEGTLLHGPT